MRIAEVHNSQGWMRRIALVGFLWLRSNTGSKVANMDLDVEKVVEVGLVKIIYIPWGWGGDGLGWDGMDGFPWMGCGSEVCGWHVDGMY